MDVNPEQNNYQKNSSPFSDENNTKDEVIILDLSEEEDCWKEDKKVSLQVDSKCNAVRDEERNEFVGKKKTAKNGKVKEKFEFIDVEDEEDDDLLFGSPIFKRGASSSSSSSSAHSKSPLGSIPTTSKEEKKVHKTRKKKSNVIKADSNSDIGKKRHRLSPEERSAKQHEEEEKALRAAEREMARQIKNQRAEVEKKAKAGRIQKEQQAAGKFAREEICVVLEKKFAEDSTLGQCLCSTLREANYCVTVPERGHIIEGCVRWIRKDYIQGGAESASNFAQNEDKNQPNDCSEWMDIVAVVFHDPKVFIKLLDRDENDESSDDYPLLREWIRKVRSATFTNSSGSDQPQDRAFMKKPRIVLVLHEVQRELSRQWNRGGRRRKSFSPTSEDELHDAVIWMLMEEGIEFELTSSTEETIEYIQSLSKSLSEAPYYESATELHCVKKIKLDKNAELPLDRSKDCWLRQLQQVPMISATKAARLVKHYPTVRSLIDAYEDPSLTEEQKRTLVATKMTDGTNLVKVSDCLYRLMTSEDPMEII